jgi:hypothetical protein
MTEFRVIIAGSRTFNDYEYLEKKCDTLLSKKENIKIISGGASGADKLGERYSKKKGYKLSVFLADWNRFGKSAGPRRNKKMGDNADALIAFWDGQSRGTKHMIDYANSINLKVRVVNY